MGKETFRKRAKLNGRNAERIAQEIFGKEIDQFGIIDIPSLGIEIKSIETDKRKSGNGNCRVKFRRNQVETLKVIEGLVFLYHHNRNRGWLVPFTALNGNKKYSWKYLAEIGTEIPV